MGLGCGFYFRMLVLTLFQCGSAVILESIYWNSSNTKFAPGQGLVLYPQIGDKMDIVCPRMRSEEGDRGKEHYRVYLVTREQLHSCRISQSDTPLLNCDKPDQDVKFTFKFQEFSPNLWGLEFLKGRDYYITSTSTGSLQGLDNPDGGVCKIRSMKLVLRVGQSPFDPPSLPKESPTRFPPQQPKPWDRDPTVKGNDTTHSGRDSDTEGGASQGDGASPAGGLLSSNVGLFVGVACGSSLLLLAIVVLLVVVCRYRHQHARPQDDRHQPTPLSLNTLAKRDSYGGNSDSMGSVPSDVVFPVRPSDMFCHHYERVSGDYGHPVYIVQEVSPQSPTNIYYKV